MHEVRGDAPGAAFVEVDALDLDPRQPTDARTDRAAGALLFGLGHVCEASVFERLASSINAEDNERIDLPLNLVIHAQIGIEPPGVILALHLACDGAFLVRGIETGDLARPAFPCDEVCPCRFDIGSKRGDEAKPGYNHTAH